MVTKRVGGVANLLQNDPFRVIEVLIAVPLFVYGIYLLTPWYHPTAASVFLVVSDGELTAQITGVLYSMAGLAMFFAAKSGRLRARQVSIMVFFASMLYSAIFRINEIGFSAMGVLFIYIAIVVAAVDYIYLNGWRQSSNQ